MAGEAAARSGAGLVSVATRPEHAALLSVARPELMCHGVATAAELGPLLERATVVAVGPGLGRARWAAGLLGRVLESGLPLVVDADALNLLAEEPVRRDRWVLTPHPGEAARLLGSTAARVQADRFAAARELQARYGGVVVLKGAGTLVEAGGTRPPGVCTEGNPGMASGGMGDVLTGLVAGLLAQGLDAPDAAETAVCVHGEAADRAAGRGERGVLATDLFDEIRALVNP
jgi:NAD(P)H-hydrate epimerase